MPHPPVVDTDAAMMEGLAETAAAPGGIKVDIRNDADADQQQKAQAEHSESFFKDVPMQDVVLKEEYFNSGARWFNEDGKAKGSKTVRISTSSGRGRRYYVKMMGKTWQVFMGLVVVTDVAVAIFIEACHEAVCLSDEQVLAWGAAVVCVLCLDLIKNIYKHKQANLTMMGFWVDVFVLALSMFALIASGEIGNIPTTPFRILRILRPVVLLKKTFDAVVDMGMDRLLAIVLGDVLYMSGSNTTCSPSEGLLVIEKTHLRPEFFEDVYLPVTVKGGFIEHLCIDFEKGEGPPAGEDDSDMLEGGDEETGQKAAETGHTGVMILSNVLLILGPHEKLEDGQGSGDLAWDIETCIRQKARLVGIAAQRGEHAAKKEHKKLKKLGKPSAGDILKSQFSKVLNSVDLSDFSVDIRNIEIRYEDNWMTAGLTCGDTSLRTTVGSAIDLGSRLFRAYPQWDHIARRTDDDPDQGSWRAPDEALGTPLRAAVRATRVATYCDCKASPDLRFRRHKLFSEYLDARPPRINEAVNDFKQLCLHRRLKTAVLAAESLRRLGRKQAPWETPTGSASTSFKLHDLQEHIQLHHYILMPMTVSAHATFLTQDMSSERAPSQVLDVHVPRMHVQIDRQQVQSFRQLECRIKNWQEKDRNLARVPIKRIFDVPPGPARKLVVSSWWHFACARIANGIVPKGRVVTELDFRRVAGQRSLYMARMVEQHVVTAKHVQKLRNQLNGVTVRTLKLDNILDKAPNAGLTSLSADALEEEINRLQFALPVNYAVFARVAAVQRYLDLTEGPGPFRRREQKALKTARTSVLEAERNMYAGLKQIVTNTQTNTTSRLSPRRLGERKTSTTSSRTAGLRKCLTKSALDITDINVGSEIRVCIRNFSVTVMQPPAESWTGGPLCQPEAIESRVQIFRAHAGGLQLVVSRSPPETAWREMEDDVSSALFAQEQVEREKNLQEKVEREKSMELQLSSDAVGPMDQGVPVPGWLAITLSAQSCLAEAPHLRPALRTIVRPMPQAGKKVATLQAARWQRLGQDGEKKGGARGVGAVSICKMDVTLYQPLLLGREGMKNMFLQKEEVAIEDPFQLGDLRARLWKKDGTKRFDRKILKLFELATGIKAASGKFLGTDWRVHADTEGVSMTMVSPYSVVTESEDPPPDGGRPKKFNRDVSLMVAHSALPACSDVFIRNYSPSGLMQSDAPWAQETSAIFVPIQGPQATATPTGSNSKLPNKSPLGSRSLLELDEVGVPQAKEVETLSERPQAKKDADEACPLPGGRSWTLCSPEDPLANQAHEVMEVGTSPTTAAEDAAASPSAAGAIEILGAFKIVAPDRLTSTMKELREMSTNSQANAKRRPVKL